eukprot:UN27912
MNANLSRNRVASVVVSPDLVETLNRRVCYVKHRINVLSLLVYTYEVAPNFCALDEFILKFRADNVQEYYQDRIKPKQPRKTIDPLQPVNNSYHGRKNDLIKKEEEKKNFNIQITRMIGLSQNWSLTKFLENHNPELETLGSNGATCLSVSIIPEKGKETKITKHRLLSDVELYTCGEACSKFSAMDTFGSYFYEKRKQWIRQQSRLAPDEEIIPNEVVILSSWHIPMVKKIEVVR